MNLRESIPDGELLTDDEINELAAAGEPTLAKVLGTQQTAIRHLTGIVQGQLAREQEEVRSDIQDAIDVNPKLAEWQTSPDQTLWRDAAAIDKVLRELPEYRNVPFEDRFKKVVELTEVAVDVKRRDGPEEQPEAQRRAEGRLSSQELEGMSTAQIGQQFAGKSFSEIEAMIATIGG